MSNFRTLQHTEWECKYHIVFIPKYRRIPPKYAVAQGMGYSKGKSAIHIARRFAGIWRSFTGKSSVARGCFVSTVGRDEEVIRQYIQHPEIEDRRQDPLKFD